MRSTLLAIICALALLQSLPGPVSAQETTTLPTTASTTVSTNSTEDMGNSTTTAPTTAATTAATAAPAGGRPTTAAPGEATTAAPGETTTAAPGATTAAPGEATTAPPGEATTAAPGEATTAAPGATTAAPGATTAAPGGTTAAPGATTTASGAVTTAAPGATTTASGAVTTAAPGVTTAAPGAATTAAPGATTTAASGSGVTGGSTTTAASGTTVAGSGTTTAGSGSGSGSGGATTTAAPGTGGGSNTTTTVAPGSGGSTTTAAATTTVVTTTTPAPPPPPEGSSVNLKLRYTIEWNASYGVAGSPEQIAKCDALKANLEAELKKKISAVDGTRCNSLKEGSVVADFDVILSSDVDGGNVEGVTAAITNITSGGTINGDPVSAADTVVTVLECTNSPPAALANGQRSWSGSKVLDVEALYTCNTGYTLRASNQEARENVTSTCKRSGDGYQFGILSGLSCVANPTTTTTTTTTTPATTTPVPTTTELTRPPPHETPYVPSEHSTFTNSLFLSITIPAVAGMVAALICFLCAIRIDSVLCKVCAVGKV